MALKGLPHRLGHGSRARKGGVGGESQSSRLSCLPAANHAFCPNLMHVLFQPCTPLLQPLRRGT